MPVTLLAPADYTRMPWRNGRGTTTEIARRDRPGAPGRFLWRVSIADVVEAGDFSAFPGYDRLIAVIEGDGMSLTIDGGTPVDRRRLEAPLRFSGDARVTCRPLGGAIRDFNLMWDRATADGALDILTEAGAHPIDATGGTVVVYAVTGSLTLTVGGADHTLGEGATAIVENAAGDVIGSDPATWLRATIIG